MHVGGLCVTVQKVFLIKALCVCVCLKDALLYNMEFQHYQKRTGDAWFIYIKHLFPSQCVGTADTSLLVEAGWYQAQDHLNCGWWGCCRID